ncbi:M1 family metallopeptidase [Geobacter grbiciae]|uniref:M1 family metallopeptidase n=1 Tax=Geobacter grbiciae TaxID=155042 RepID=UPI001C00FF89|nr:M1 family aminopeptidase [Geobacter grbiciae]MBT1076379.1 M1 family peptidase [Geobacter grbiciae]
MKALVFFLIVLVSPLVLFSACTARGEVRLLRQEITVRLEPERHLLLGTTVLELPRGASGRLTVSLNQRAAVDGVTVDGRKADFSRAGEAVAVALPRESGTSPRRVLIRYQCTFNDPAPERPVDSEDPSYGVSGAITARGTYLGSDAGWYPAPQTLPESRRVTVTAPAGIEAITAGRRIARSTAKGTTSSTWEEARPVEGLSLSAGPYVIGERSLDGIPLYSYFYPENASLAARYLEASAGYIRFYVGKFGPYPFEKFAVVENFFPTGYGFPSYTLIGGTVIRLPFIVHTSLPHEIAHCWWGNGVLVDYRQGNWSEGLVTYLADYLLEERKSGRDGRDYRFRILADYASLVKKGEDFPLTRFRGRMDPASRSIGYGKGAMLFHMVRKRIGDEAFFGALRELFREKRFSVATWDDFVRAFSRASGEELTSFVTPWLHQPGGPRLALSGVTQQRNGAGWLVTGAVRRDGEGYDLGVTVRVEAGGRGYDRTVALTGEETPFAVPVPTNPEEVVLDPEVDLFRILSRDELPLTVNRIKGSRTLAAVVTRTCGADDKTLGLFLRSLGQGDAPLLSEETAGEISLADRDLLFCGMPTRPGLLPPLLPGVTAAAGGFAVNGMEYQGSGDLVFMVLNRPEASGRVMALLLANAPAGAEAAALKITHYGRYGLLVFSGGENRVKETSRPPGGGSIVRFAR